MKLNKILIILMKQIKIWKTTPQLKQHKEWNRRKLIKAFLLYKLLKKKEGQQRRFWVRPIFSEERRYTQGASNNLIKEMENIDPEKYLEYLRMSVTSFTELLNLIEPIIMKQDAVRISISARTRLQICLRYLASGDSMASISFAFRVGVNTVSKIITETCEAIWNILKERVFPEITEDLWIKKANDFENMWDFPNCIGAIDRKHMEIQAPTHSGSTYYNYKGTHSIVLIALADANYMFTIVDIGAEGRRSDGGILQESKLGYYLENNRLNLPKMRSISENGPEVPYVIVGDEAFALTSYMLRPYPRADNLNLHKKVFNYRLSRARRVVECAFGLLSAKWRIFRRPMSTNVDHATSIVKAAVCLHNFLIMKDLVLSAQQRTYSINILPQDTNSCQNTQIPKISTSNISQRGGIIRDLFTNYFCKIGVIEQQWEKARNNDF